MPLKLHLFDNDTTREELKILSEKHIPILRIAKIYHVDRTTVYYWLNLYGFKLSKRFSRGGRLRKLRVISKSTVRHLVFKPKYTALLEEPVNTGKSYKEYLAERNLKIKNDQWWGKLPRKVLPTGVQYTSRSYTTMLYNKEHGDVKSTNHIKTPARS